MTRKVKIWTCFLFGGHTWGFHSYINGNIDKIKCVNCPLEWHEKHPTDWRML